MLQNRRFRRVRRQSDRRERDGDRCAAYLYRYSCVRKDEKIMQWTGLNELREKYLSFFESKGH